jgi:hypothetical protein
MKIVLLISSVLSAGILLKSMVSASTTLSQSDLSVSGAALAKCDRSTIVDPQYPTTGISQRRREDMSAADINQLKAIFQN